MNEKGDESRRTVPFRIDTAAARRTLGVIPLENLVLTAFP